jgi:hypothetical protein
MTDELLLFFKVSQKIGANQLEIFLRKKVQWINTLLNKFSTSMVGYPKDDVNPFNSLRIKSNFTVDAGKSMTKTVEIYRECSLFYFSFFIEDNDINLRLFYLGDFDSKIEVKKLIHLDEKKSGLAKFAFIANKRGIYSI